MVKRPNINELKKQIVSSLQPLNPDKIILFGSYAYGTPTFESDIDICVVKDNIDSKYSEAVKCRKCLSFLDMDKDILVENEKFLFEHSSEKWINSVWYDIVHDGEVLYEKK